MSTPSLIASKKFLTVWQVLFMAIGTGWLWAPIINTNLSTKISRISDFEAVNQHYSWLFRLMDLTASLLLLLLARRLAKNKQTKTASIFLTIISIGIIIDILIPVSCRPEGNACVEYLSASSVIHLVESSITALTVFALSIYSLLKTKRIVTYSFIILQLVYLVQGLISLLGFNEFNTIFQYIYDSGVILWLAWFVRESLSPHTDSLPEKKQTLVRPILAGWIFINGIFAVLISLAHIRLLGRLDGLYFANDTAWLAQHGVIIGIAMIYLSRHLARGEMRARQLIMAIVGLEAIKYSIITPNPLFLGIYVATFISLFVLRDSFYRNTQPLTREVRLHDLYYVATGLASVSIISFFILDRDEKISEIARSTFRHYFRYVSNPPVEAHHHLASILLAHTASVFFITALITVFWILFKPSKIKNDALASNVTIKELLSRYSLDSEDYFKLWPHDKQYYFAEQDQSGFIAYKQAGSIVFALADPIGSDKQKYLDEFVAWTRSLGLKSCFMLVRENNLHIYKNAGLESLQVGSSAMIDISEFTEVTAKDKWWRWQKNRAAKAGYTYTMARPPHTEQFLREIGEVSDSWLGRSNHVERGFAMGYFDYDYMNECVIHYLKNESGSIVAFANQLPALKDIDTSSVDLIRFIPTENNTMPVLLLNIISSLHENSPHVKYFDLGFVPFAKTSSQVMKITKVISSTGFSSSGLQQFKNKFDPNWQPNYIVYDGDISDLPAIVLNLEKVLRIDNN